MPLRTSTLVSIGFLTLTLSCAQTNPQSFQCSEYEWQSVHEPNRGLDQISKLVEKGQIKQIMDGPSEFDKIPELIQYFGEGKPFGKDCR